MFEGCGKTGSYLSRVRNAEFKYFCFKIRGFSQFSVIFLNLLEFDIEITYFKQINLIMIFKALRKTRPYLERET